jgi:hypothetical protein
VEWRAGLSDFFLYLRMGVYRACALYAANLCVCVYMCVCVCVCVCVCIYIYRVYIYIGYIYMYIYMYGGLIRTN